MSRGIGYYIAFPSQGPAIFWLSFQKIVEATLWVGRGSEKEHETVGGGGKATTFERMTWPRAQHKPIKNKWVPDDKSNSTNFDPQSAS